MTEAPAGNPVPLKAITLLKDTEEQLGFSIRGGSEYGLGIFISDVEDDSAAGNNDVYLIQTNIVITSDSHI